MSSLRHSSNLFFNGISASKRFGVQFIHSARAVEESGLGNIVRNFGSFQLVQKKQIHTTARYLDTFHVQDEEDFNKRVLKSSKPVVVQFHATWCGPCKMLSPRMEKCIAATKEAVDLAQVDIDNNPDIAMSYSVGAVPAVLAIKDGKVVDKFVGLKDEDEVDTFVGNLLK